MTVDADLRSWYFTQRKAEPWSTIHELIMSNRYYSEPRMSRQELWRQKQNRKMVLMLLTAFAVIGSIAGFLIYWR